MNFIKDDLIGKSLLFRMMLLTVMVSLSTIALVPANSANAGTGIIRGTQDAVGGVYWRSAPDWNTAVRAPGNGVYPDSRLELNCFQTNGGTVPPYWNNSLWYQARVVGGSGSGSGWINDHFLNTGINRPNIPVSGVPRCGTNNSQPAATAPPQGTYVSRSWQLRYCVESSYAGCNPATSAANRAPSIAALSPVAMVCYQDGSDATGDYTTNRWFWVRSANDVQGFVSASVVRNQTKVPHCSTSLNIRIASQAAKYSGEVTASGATASLFQAREWSPGPVNEWAGDCPKLPYAAVHFAAGRDMLKGDAIANYRTYVARGVVRGGTPSVGSVVYFNVTAWGHTAVYLGGGMVATTTNTDGWKTPNTITQMGGYPNYLGWVHPSNL